MYRLVRSFSAGFGGRPIDSRCHLVARSVELMIDADHCLLINQFNLFSICWAQPRRSNAWIDL